jgi:hypothetical protein
VQVRRVGLARARRCCRGCASDFGDANAISLRGFVEKREGREGLFVEGKAWARG